MGNSSSRRTRTLSLSESHSSSRKKVSNKQNKKPREKNNRTCSENDVLNSPVSSSHNNNEEIISSNSNINNAIRSHLPPIVSPFESLAAAIGASSSGSGGLQAFSANGRNGHAYDGVYQLHNLLGRGGFGRVYRATYIHHNNNSNDNGNQSQRQQQREFAIKVTKPVEVLQEIPLHTYDDITTKVGEIKALLRLHKGPSILQLQEFYFDFGGSSVEFPLAIVTELLTGSDLATWLKERAEQAMAAAATATRNNNNTHPAGIPHHHQMDTTTCCITERVASIIMQSLLDAVLFMHEKLVVHRDLKITNLRITNPDDPRSIKVYDFGLARVLDHEGERSLVDECGSRGYTAPEVLLCHPYGVEVDMFSVGVILFIVLSGYRPFAGGNRNDVKRRIVQGEYSLDSQRWNRVSEMAKNLVRGLLVERRHRLTAQEAVQHEWFNDDPQSIAILEQSNINDNAVLIPVSPDEEPLLSRHSGTSSPSQTSIHMVPAVQQAIATVQAVYSSASPRQQQQHQQDGGAHAISSLSASVPLLQQQQQYVVSSINLSPGSISLPEYVARHLSSYTEEDCRFLCRKILTAVATLHERNLAHRAIRMEHIYIQRETDTGEIQVSLAGMEYARVSHEGQTLTGTVGTPLVATAPEVYTHLSYNGQAVDVWALGVLIYMLLCGMYPFRGTERELKRNVRNGTIVFDAVVPSENAQDLVYCMIQVHPDARLCVSDALLHPWFQQDSSSDDLKQRDLGLTQAMMSDWIRRPTSSSASPRRPLTSPKDSSC